MAQQLQPVSETIHIKHGHTESQVLVQFNKRIDFLLLTEPEAENFLGAVAESLRLLREYRTRQAH